MFVSQKKRFFSKTVSYKINDLKHGSKDCTEKSKLAMFCRLLSEYQLVEPNLNNFAYQSLGKISTLSNPHGLFFNEITAHSLASQDSFSLPSNYKMLKLAKSLTANFGWNNIVFLNNPEIIAASVNTAILEFGIANFKHRDQISYAGPDDFLPFEKLKTRITKTTKILVVEATGAFLQADNFAELFELTNVGKTLDFFHITLFSLCISFIGTEII